jgi:hypothetical protein
MNGPQEIVALDHEIHEVAGLLRSGITTFMASEFDPDWGSPALACLAPGAERFLKLTLGFARLRDNQPWLTEAELRRYSHHVVTLDHDARTDLQDHLGGSTVAGLVQDITADADRDPYLPDLLGLLDRYGSAGRFCNLSIVAGSPQIEETPAVLWRQLSNKIATDQGLLADFADATRRTDAEQILRGTVVASLLQWLDLYRQGWQSGVFGSLPKNWAWIIKKVADTITVKE